ncbi:glycosyltransferase [Sutterella sp.]|uniref:glycosyltransferase n=1 Tax=Sutterella sp. TaxID=1981025 RepID=UPI0026DEF96B|nr:glycosyltransferase [Sutterella sp.]MDO5532642.1 glycosyltransferase [Sutterella sp.]
MKISVIVSTYNWPSALRLSLLSLMRQTDGDFEIVVADDGSGEETRKLIEEMAARSSVPVIHSWQEDKGFRLARSRNEAVKKATGDFLIFIDGDCIVPKDFIGRYRSLIQQGRTIVGPRILLEELFTKELLDKGESVEFEQFDSWRAARELCRAGKCNRSFAATVLPLGNFLRNRAGSRWQHLRGCNWGLSREDFLKVGGQDESFEGWGQEDSDMAIRLINAGVPLRSGRFGGIPVYHLWHRQNTRKDQTEKMRLLEERIRQKVVQPVKGISL